MKWTLENKISSGLGLALLIVVVIVSITYRVTTCIIQDADWVTHSPKVMEALNDLRSTCVRDDGVGFDMQYGDKLFTPFQRLHRMNIAIVFLTSIVSERETRDEGELYENDRGFAD